MLFPSSRYFKRHLAVIILVLLVAVIPAAGGPGVSSPGHGSVLVSVSPAAVALKASETLQLTAMVSGQADQTVSWSINPLLGSISRTGLYVAPAGIYSQQMVTVTAISVADPTQSATATIVLTPVVSVSLSPNGAALVASQTQQFTPIVSGTMDPSVTWSINPPLGGISSSGQYTAPPVLNARQTVTLTATSVADPTKAAAVSIVLSPLVTVSLSPSSVMLTASQSQQFTASIGGASNQAAVWQLTPPLGAISSSGLYTAPSTINTQQNVTLTVTSVADPSKSATSTITLQPVSVILNVNGATLGPSQSQQFTATIPGINSPGVVWTLSPAVGTVSSSGLYTAPTTITSQQTIALTATSIAYPSKSATVFITLQPSQAPPPPLSPVMLPLEVVGLDGYLVSAQVNVASVPAGNLQLSMRLHGIRYDNQASVQVNNGAWTPIAESTVTLAGPALSYGGIGGGFHTLQMTMNLPGGSLVAGANTIRFRFNGTDGRVSGFRVLAFNFLDSNNSALVASQSFVYEDPNTWQPPSTLASDIAAGKTAWYQANLTVPTPNGAAPITAHCTSCHAQDGRDLKYFNYSNNSIRARSMFHGLTAQQGDQIASYIRSLNVPNPGRPWNPPFQPGPGLDSLPVSQWSAGAGIDAVLNDDSDLITELFPGGIQASTFAATGNLNVRETAVPLQLPDWNSWLPTIHPQDEFPDFLASKFHQDYLTIRAGLKVNDPVAYANTEGYFGSWNVDFSAFLAAGNKNPNNGTTPDPNFWTPQYVMAIYSTGQWAMVKSWELNQEFGLEDMTGAVFTNPQHDPRAWLTGMSFLTSPNMLHIPAEMPGLDNSRLNTFHYIAFIWYHTQLILNNSNKEQSGNFPIDWEYTYGFLAGLSYYDHPGQAGLLYLWQIKALQISNNGVGPESQDDEWLWYIMDPSIQVYQGTGSASIWTGVPAATRTALYSSWLRAYLDVVKKFTPQQYYAGGDADPTLAPVHGSPFGNWGDRTWYTIPVMRYFGVSQTLLNEYASWAQTIWPLANWTQAANDVCVVDIGSGLQCLTQH